MEESEFNPLHGSDSITAADREIQKIFPVQTTVAVIKPEAAAEMSGTYIFYVFYMFTLKIQPLLA